MVLEEIRYEVLLDVLTYLYTDAVRIDLGNSFELFQARAFVCVLSCVCVSFARAPNHACMHA